MSRFAENLNVQNNENSSGNCVHYIRTECLDLQKNWISWATKIQRKIVYVIYVQNVWISKKMECPELQKFNGKFCTLYVRKVWICKKLKIQNFENSMENCVHYICTECWDLQKKWISRTAKIQREIVYIIYVQNVWICKKIDYPELQKFNGKLCTLYVYKKSGFAENLNIQNYKNWMANCVHDICTEHLDSQKIWISRTAKIQLEIVYIIYLQNVLISWKIEYSELRKFHGKFCMLYMYWMCRLAKKLNVQNFVNYTGKCTLYVRNVQSCRKIEYSEQCKFNGKLYTFYVRNVWICRKFEYHELRKFNSIFST